MNFIVGGGIVENSRTAPDIVPINCRLVLMDTRGERLWGEESLWGCERRPVSDEASCISWHGSAPLPTQLIALLFEYESNWLHSERLFFLLKSAGPPSRNPIRIVLSILSNGGRRSLLYERLNCYEWTSS